MLAMFASFGVTLIIVRTFGAEGLGKLSVVNAMLYYCLLISGYGIEMYAVREVAANRQPLSNMIPSLFAIRLGTAIIVYFTLLAFVFFLPAFKPQLDLFIVMGFTLLIVPFRTAWAAQAKGSSHILGLFNLALELCYLSAVLIVALMPLALINLAWSRVMVELLVTGLLAVYVYQNFASFSKPFPLVQLKLMIRQAWPFTMYPLLRGLALGTDLILLSFFVSASSVGLYTGASKLFFVLLTLSGSYIAVIYPRLSSISDEPLKSTYKRILHLYQVVLPIGLFGVLVLLQLSDFILVLLFGGEFLSASVSLGILSVAFLANLSARHYQQLLLVTQNQQLDFKIVFRGTAIHMVAKLLLIPSWGIEGAALGTAIGEISMLLMYMLVVNRLAHK